MILPLSIAAGADTFPQEMARLYGLIDDSCARKVWPQQESPSDAAFPDREPEIRPGLPDGARIHARAWQEGRLAFIATDEGLFQCREGQFLRIEPASPPPGPQNRAIRALAVDGENLWAGTEEGLHLYSGGRWLTFSGPDGLPVTGITHLSVGPPGVLWIGTGSGAIRLEAGRWHYYAGRRWLPDNVVIGLQAGPKGDCLVTTRTGRSHIYSVEMSLERKSVHYEAITASRHNRNGYVTDCRLTRPGDLTSALPEASDNDGLWTSLYVAAECFRYAATADTEARALAAGSLGALLDLVRVTGIPGFPARALIRDGERVYQSDPGPNWYRSPVRPDVLFKSDTSSDELAGHYLAWFLYSALVADANEKTEIARICRAVTNHILDHNFTLVGPAGTRTTWGVWTPHVLNDDPDWAAERGLNSLEILSHLKVACALCGDTRFDDAYHSLIREHGYALNTVNQKIVPPAGENNHSDDELAACAYYPLLLLEREPALRSLYLLSLERTRAILRPEGSSFHDLLMGALGGADRCDSGRAVAWLREAPWDLIHWDCDNRHRADIAVDPNPGRFGEVQARRVLPPGERNVAKWNHNPYALLGGNGGAGEEDGTFWLLPYWMGRYHGLIEG